MYAWLMHRGEAIMALVGYSVALVLVTFVFVRQAERANCEAAAVTPMEQAIEQHNTTAAADQPKLIEGVQAEQRQAAHTRKLIVQEAAHAPATTSVCVLDPDSLRRWRSANLGAGVSNPTAPGSATSGDPAAAGGEQRDRAGDQSHRDGRRLPPAARAIHAAAGLAGHEEDHRAQ